MAHSKLAKPKFDMTEEEIEAAEQEEFKTGPFSTLSESVKGGTQVLISLRNDKKLLCHVRAFDRHFNMVIENVTEMWTDFSRAKKGKKTRNPVNKERFISKMFLRGDSVILVVRNPKVVKGKGEGTSGEEKPRA